MGANINDIEQIGFNVAFNTTGTTYLPDGTPAYQGDDYNVLVKNAIPEPMSLSLLGLGILGLFGLRKKT